MSTNRMRVELGVLSMILVACSTPEPPKQTAVAANEATKETTSTAPIGNQNWRATADTSRLDNTVKTHLILNQSEHSLVIRIINGRIADFYVQTPTAVTDREGEVEVRFKIDSNPIIRQTWHTSEDYRAIFAPDAYFFVKDLTNASELVFEYKPWLKDTKEVTFRTAGLPAFLSHLVDSTAQAIDVARIRRDSVSRALRRIAWQRHVDSIKARIADYGIDPCSALEKQDQAAIGVKCP